MLRQKCSPAVAPKDWHLAATASDYGGSTELLAELRHPQALVKSFSELLAISHRSGQGRRRKAKEDGRKPRELP